MTSAQVCILISIAVYLIAMLAIGIVCSKRNNTAVSYTHLDVYKRQVLVVI